jgi:UDP-N-acetylglucosamine 4,6-dehydratase/5-epimerase
VGVRVLITGGTGSLGRALAQQWWGLHRVIVFSRDEFKQARMAQVVPGVDFFLGDVRDVERLKLAFHGCDVVIHAAALKRVDAVAGDPFEVVKTNVLGTWNVLQAALYAGVPKVLFISSDKAVQPTNAYGASKFSGEQLVTAFNTFGVPQGVRASVLRYGNVLGSRGSVVHVWRGQGNTLTLTAPGMTRFIITMPQAVAAVEQALELMEGGEVFVPHLPAARMEDLAEAVKPGCEKPYVGLRPGGEKLHEVLMTREESERAVDGALMVIRPYLHSWRKEWPQDESPAPVGELVSSGAQMLTVKELEKLLRWVPKEDV